MCTTSIEIMGGFLSACMDITGTRQRKCFFFSDFDFIFTVTDGLRICLLNAQYLLNQCEDFHQTCMDILLG